MGSNFFGLTTLGGASGSLRDKVAVNTTLPFHEIAQETYLAVFQKYVVGATPIALEVSARGAQRLLGGGQAEHTTCA